MMMYAHTDCPELVAGIAEIVDGHNALAAARAKVRELEAALADAKGTLDMYRAIYAIADDDCKKLRRLVREDLRLICDGERKAYSDGYAAGYKAAVNAVSLKVRKRHRG